MSDFILVKEPLLSGKEKQYLLERIDSGWISSEGPFVKQSEEMFAKRVERNHGISSPDLNTWGICFVVKK
jgi:perosamine synthetase